MFIHQLENHKFRGICIVHDFQSLSDQLSALKSIAAAMRAAYIQCILRTVTMVFERSYRWSLGWSRND
jgi:hypothetical protein